jgi:nucleoside-diphosphate-sugar epimerase
MRDGVHSSGSRVLVTGGAGFIGSHFVEAALNQGYSVRVFDDLSTGSLKNLQDIQGHPHLEFVRGDVRRAKQVGTAFEGVEAVVHLAALVSVPLSVKVPARTLMTNTLGTLNVLIAATRSNIRRMVYASTCAVYGEPPEVPVKEDAPTSPLSPYAASKLAGEALCDAYAACHGLETVTLRFFNVYGKGQSPGPYSGVITKFLDNLRHDQPPTIYGDGAQTRDFIYVADVAGAILRAMDADIDTAATISAKINVGTGRAVTISDLADLLIRLTGRTLIPRHEPAREGEIQHSVSDTSRARRLLGFQVMTPLETGLRELL